MSRRHPPPCRSGDVGRAVYRGAAAIPDARYTAIEMRPVEFEVTTDLKPRH